MLRSHYKRTNKHWDTNGQLSKVMERFKQGPHLTSNSLRPSNAHAAFSKKPFLLLSGSVISQRPDLPLSSPKPGLRTRRKATPYLCLNLAVQSNFIDRSPISIRFKNVQRTIQHATSAATPNRRPPEPTAHRPVPHDPGHTPDAHAADDRGASAAPYLLFE